MDKLINLGCVVCKNCKGDILSTAKMGGRVRAVAYPTSLKCAVECLKHLNTEGIDKYIIGNGSNTLISDDGFDGLMFCTKKMIEVKLSDNLVYAQAGVRLPLLATFAKENALSGLEFAAAIPATVGGGIAMNCGAFECEIADICEYVDVFIDGELRRLSKDEMKFSYRNSIIQKIGGVVVGAGLRLCAGKTQEIVQKMYLNNRIRLATQPTQPSLGSVFKRIEGVCVPKIIQELGLRGKVLRGVKISDIHSNFIVNTGKGCAKDYADMVDFIVEKVYNKHKILLTTEVKFVGYFKKSSQ